MSGYFPYTPGADIVADKPNIRPFGSIRYSVLIFLCLAVSYSRDIAAQPTAADDGAKEIARQNRSVEQARISEADRARTQREARRRGWAISATTPEGVEMQIREWTALGPPAYFAPLIEDAGISTATDLVRDSPGGFPLGGGFQETIDAAGFPIGIWDQGLVGISHPEFIGRVSSPDGTSAHSFHSTLVAGMAAAAGVDPTTKGMAPAADIHSYTFVDDLAEMILAGRIDVADLNGLTVSNHSYSRAIVGWQLGNFLGTGAFRFWFGSWGELEDSKFGAYNSSSQSIDQICHDAPYFLPFWAAGNDRSTGSGGGAPSNGETFYYYDVGAMNYVTEIYDSSIHPLSDRDANAQGAGFDTLIPSACAKNVISVGSVTAAVDMPGGIRVPANATPSTFSSWGPTDDGRIKPDLVGVGTGVYGPTGSSGGYGTGNGTSYAAPNLAGSALLLQDYYSRLTGGDLLRSDAMRALLIHTATDIGNLGPDYTFGWGLLDTLAAANFLLNDQENLDDLGLQLGELIQWTSPLKLYTVTSDGAEPLKVTLAWIDPPGSTSAGLDDPTPALVNNLDMRVEGPGGPYFPWILDPNAPSAPATRGDNRVDNVEVVEISTPVAGDYTVRIFPRGSLQDGRQTFALLISGQTAVISGIDDWASFE